MIHIISVSAAVVIFSCEETIGEHNVGQPPDVAATLGLGKPQNTWRRRSLLATGFAIVLAIAWYGTSLSNRQAAPQYVTAEVSRGSFDVFVTATGTVEPINLFGISSRRVGRDEEDDFTVMDMKQIATMLPGITDILTGLLAAVAMVSLLVGGIGIINIMLVSVTERTREIGIRLAVGAKAGQVLMQFLVEAIVLSLIGDLIGVVLGLLLAYVGARALSDPLTPDVSIFLISFAFSALGGVIFGYFPARRATRLNPIEALRRE